MNKYAVIFKVPTTSMEDWMKNVSEDERKRQTDQMMKDWMSWSEKHKAAIVEGGTPLGKTKTVTKDGITDTRNDLNYYMVIQAASHEEAAQLFTDNPHVQMIPSSSVDVMTISHPGM